MGGGCSVGDRPLPRAPKLDEITPFQRYKIAKLFGLLDKTKSGKVSARDYQLWGTKAATRNNVSFESDKVARWTDAFNSAQNNDNLIQRKIGE